MAARGADVLAAVAGSAKTERVAAAGIGRLTTAAPGISLVDVIGIGCGSSDAIVQADDAIATASSRNTRFMVGPLA